MKIIKEFFRINEYGNLIRIVTEAGHLKDQDCPYSQRQCGNHCPLFGEPYENIDVHSNKGTVTLRICGCKTITLSNIEDTQN